MVDGVGEVAFEYSECFEAAVAVCFASVEQRFGGSVNTDLGDGDAVESGVQLAVPDTAELMSLMVR